MSNCNGFLRFDRNFFDFVKNSSCQHVTTPGLFVKGKNMNYNIKILRRNYIDVDPM